ncbi:hypothetical protein [Protaetiibacter intestinalis]|uniref:Uncharacterized protein n=1 Tax=Protaetiibacter intestinalis TaxID=2419774 RepID=A0A387B4K2_9MICO|nr:hypothetical protein [Protaetiibacter intestinalis]AYF98574.1 hypothetical protein D7I47_10085 [Protaetiibacter intestinalis]
MTPRPRRALPAMLAAAASLLGAIAVASPAAADEADCADASLAQGGYSIFELQQRFVPEPLRGTGWDCATRIADRPFEDGRYDISYTLLWAGIGAGDAIGILERFADAGWLDGTEMISATASDGRTENDRMAASSLRGWDPPPSQIITRFSDARDGENIIEFDFEDGLVGAVDPGLEAPTLEIAVYLRAPVDATGASDPSVLSSLRTIAQALPSSTQLAFLGGSAVFLMLVVGFPGYLFNKVLEKHWSGFARWLHLRRRRRVSKPPRPGSAAEAAFAADAAAGAPARRAPSWLVWPGFVAAAIISGFVDPAFGPNPMSVRLLVTALISFVLLNVVGWLLVIGVLRRIQPDARPRITFRWGSLVVVALTVLVARLLDFQPGVVFGLVAGLTFAITLAASRDALVILLGSGAALAMAGLAWIGFSALAPVADAVPGSVLLRGVVELCSGVVVEGISTLPLALLPLLALDGAVLFAWRKWVWAVAYAVGAAAFVLVMFTIPEAWGEIGGGFGRWLLLFVGLAALAVGAWAVDVVIERRRKAAGPAPAGG